MADPWGIRGFKGEGGPRRSKLYKQKNRRKNLKNREKSRKFFYWKWSEKHWEPNLS